MRSHRLLRHWPAQLPLDLAEEVAPSWPLESHSEPLLMPPQDHRDLLQLLRGQWSEGLD
jgi:hypothetical protein